MIRQFCHCRDEGVSLFRGAAQVQPKWERATLVAEKVDAAGRHPANPALPASRPGRDRPRASARLRDIRPPRLALTTSSSESE
jgi:hypothetical protein